MIVPAPTPIRVVLFVTALVVALRLLGFPAAAGVDATRDLELASPDVSPDLEFYGAPMISIAPWTDADGES